MKDQIECAIQVLRQVEAGDGVFVGQCADAIECLESLLANPSDKQEADDPFADWELIRVKHLSELVDALDRADRKGYMPDAIADSWEAFQYVPAAPIAQSAEQDRIDAEYREVGVWEPDGSKFKTYRNENLNGVAMYVRGASK